MVYGEVCSVSWLVRREHFLHQEYGLIGSHSREKKPELLQILPMVVNSPIKFEVLAFSLRNILCGENAKIFTHVEYFACEIVVRGYV